jgi:protein-glutamine gamma-glutamyltransferase
MLRTLGVPARAASGFAPPSRRMGSGSAILIQDSDAHQWCEVYFQGLGWVVVDASLGRSITPPEPEPDPATQSHYSEKNRDPEENAIDQLRNAEESVRLAALARFAAGTSGFCFILLLLVAIAIKVWRRLAPRLVPESKLDRVGYRAVLDRLAEVGLIRGFGETRGEFAGRVARVVPEFVRATEAFDRQSLTGRGGLNRDTWLEVDSKVSAMLASTFPAGKRLLGLANPLAWRRTR